MSIATLPPAIFTGTLRDYQTEGVDHLLSNQKTLLADDMGLGKTVVTLAGIAAGAIAPVLIVAPSTVQRQWANQAEKFIGMNPVILRGQKPYRIPRTQMVVIHYGLLAYWKRALLEHGFSLVVFDELQELCHPDAAKYDAARALADAADFAWALSGTPVRGYGKEFHSVMDIVRPGCLGTKRDFARRWCSRSDKRFVRNPAALGDHLRDAGLMLRRRKEDVALEMPPHQIIEVETEQDESVYAGLISKAKSAARRVDQITDARELCDTMKMIEEVARKATGIAKAPFVAEFAVSLLKAGARPLIYAWHHEVHDMIMQRVGKDARIARISGRDEPEEKEARVAMFRRGELDALILSLRCAAGLDGLQDRATCNVVAELDWTPAVEEQCIARAVRPGSPAAMIHTYRMVSMGSYDAVVASGFDAKRRQRNAVMGDPGKDPDKTTEDESAARSHMQRLIEQLRVA